MSIEVTVLVPFTYETEDVLMEGTAEIYGGLNDYDVVALRNQYGVQWITDAATFKAIRSELLEEPYVYDTVAEAIYWEHHAT